MDVLPELQRTNSHLLRLPEALVRRAHLEALLEGGVRRRLTVLSAPPGAGKTILLAGWVNRHPEQRVAWLAVERTDNRPGSFARSVVNALAGINAVSSVGERGGDANALLTEALHELDVRREPVVLVLDDVQELTSANAIHCLEVLVEHGASALEIIMATRADPPLRLGRLRVNGWLGEIRNSDLAFTPAEAAELFAARGIRMTHQEIMAIHERTEGWAAGLQLIAFALDQGADPKRFALDDAPAEAAVSDYLLREVLARQNERVQDFLMHTSIVDYVTPELAVTLSDYADAGSLLEELERGGVFLSEFNGTGVYRYHALFASLLRARLRQHDLGLYRALHARAARWYAERSMPLQAEAHARAGENWDLLGEYVRGRWLDGVLHGFETSPEDADGISMEAARASPSLAIVASAAACEMGKRELLEQYKALTGGGNDGGDATTLDHRSVSALVLDVLEARAFGSCSAGRDAVERLQPGASTDPRLARFCSLSLAEFDLDDGKLEEARFELAGLADDDSGWVSGTAHALLALVHAIDGRVRAAETLARDSLARPIGSDRVVVTRASNLALAISQAQRGLLRAAVAAVGDTSATVALRSLRAVEHAVHAGLSNTSFVGHFNRSTARHPLVDKTLVALGVLEIVDAAGASVTFGGPAEEALRRSRRALDANMYTTVFAEADEWLRPNVEGGTHPRTLVELSVLATISAWARAEHELALGHLQHALVHAGPDQIWAPLVAYGPMISAPLATIAREPGSHQSAAMSLIDESHHMESPAFIQPLTTQELAVLMFLPTLRSNSEIAAAMHLSTNTVKSHLKAIYRKFGVERRRDAVVRAHQLELL
jgi:LuxR family maltose regulon positive regulatory protein